MRFFTEINNGMLAKKYEIPMYLLKIITNKGLKLFYEEEYCLFCGESEVLCNVDLVTLENYCNFI